MKENLKWWHSPYSWREKVDFLHYRIAQPSMRNASGLPLDQEPMQWQQRNADGDVVRIAFLGDFMPIGRRTLQFGEALRKQLAQVDYVVINVEGVITPKRRYLAVTFDPSILAQINALFPQKIIFNVANNHVADFGRAIFEEQMALLREYGQVIGHNDDGLRLPEGVYLRSATMLTNQPIQVCAWANPEDADRIRGAASMDTYNIYIPHWGYEMHLFPEHKHVSFADTLLHGTWDAVVGSHPHVPQPLWQREDDKLCLFSLGNFCYENVNPNHSYGKLLILSVSHTTHRLTAFSQHYTAQTLIGDDRLSVDLRAQLDYRQLRAHSPKNLHYLTDLIK